MAGASGGNMSHHCQLLTAKEQARHDDFTDLGVTCTGNALPEVQLFSEEGCVDSTP